MDLGGYIIRYRGQNKMTSKEFAEKVNYSYATISHIENGWSEKCSLGKFAKIVVLMNLTADEVLDIVKTIVDAEKENAKSNC